MRVMPHGIAIDALFPLRLQRFNRLGLFNHFYENQPSVSRRSEFFAMHRVAFGLDHFAFGDLPTFRWCKEGHFAFTFAANAARSALGSSPFLKFLSVDHVCFEAVNGLKSDIAPCPKSAKSGL